MDTGTGGGFLNPSALAYGLARHAGPLPRAALRGTSRPATRRAAYSPKAADAAIRAGLPGSTLKTLKRLYGMSNRELGELIGVSGDKTFAKRLASRALSGVESDRVWRLLRAYSAAWVALDGDDEAVAQWFQRPATRLGGEVPLRLLHTEEGARLVATALQAIEHGLPV